MKKIFQKLIAILPSSSKQTEKEPVGEELAPRTEVDPFIDPIGLADELTQKNSSARTFSFDSSRAQILGDIGDDPDQILSALTRIVLEDKLGLRGGAALETLTQSAESSDQALDILLDLVKDSELEQIVCYRLLKIRRRHPKLELALVNRLKSYNDYVVRAVMEELPNRPEWAEDSRVLEIIGNNLGSFQPEIVNTALDFFLRHPRLTPPEKLITLLQDERFHEKTADLMDATGLNTNQQLASMAHPRSRLGKARYFLGTKIFGRLWGIPGKSCPQCGRGMLERWGQMETYQDIPRGGGYFLRDVQTHTYLTGYYCAHCNIAVDKDKLTSVELWEKLQNRQTLEKK